MATTYVGFWRGVPGAEEAAQAVIRETGSLPPALREKTSTFAKNLPPTCKLVGSWFVSGGVVPGVVVIEAESYADIVHVNQHYAGWIWFDWHPANTVARDQ